MGVAFCGLFMSNMLMLNTFALVLVSAVLIDSFIVRTLIVPAFVHLFGEVNWWLVKYEKIVYVYEEADEYHIYDHLDSEDQDEENAEKKEEKKSKSSSSSSSEKKEDHIKADEEEQFKGNDKTPLLN